MLAHILHVSVCIIITSPEIVFIYWVLCLYLLIISRSHYRLLCWVYTVKRTLLVKSIVVDIVHLISIVIAILVHIVIWLGIQTCWVVPHVMSIWNNFAYRITIKLTYHNHLVFSAIKQISWIVQVVRNCWGIVWVETWRVSIRTSYTRIENAKALTHVTTAWWSSYSIDVYKISWSRLWWQIPHIIWAVSQSSKSTTSTMVANDSCTYLIINSARAILCW
jgi:hypothetical protein